MPSARRKTRAPRVSSQIPPGLDVTYVPKVAYPCGACDHDDTLILPCGIGDQSISTATLLINALLAALLPVQTCRRALDILQQ